MNEREKEKGRGRRERAREEERTVDERRKKMLRVCSLARGCRVRIRTCDLTYTCAHEYVRRTILVGACAWSALKG